MTAACMLGQEAATGRFRAFRARLRLQLPCGLHLACSGGRPRPAALLSRRGHWRGRFGASELTHVPVPPAFTAFADPGYQGAQAGAAGEAEGCQDPHPHGKAAGGGPGLGAPLGCGQGVAGRVRSPAAALEFDCTMVSAPDVCAAWGSCLNPKVCNCFAFLLGCACWDALAAFAALFHSLSSTGPPPLNRGCLQRLCPAPLGARVACTHAPCPCLVAANAGTIPHTGRSSPCNDRRGFTPGDRHSAHTRRLRGSRQPL